MEHKINNFNLSESFYSIQGEGVTTGYPAYFIRLSDCNLQCGCSNKFLNQFKKDIDQFKENIFVGDLEATGAATWTCDSAPVWIKGKETDFNFFIKDWRREEILNEIFSGTVHIIWTGGEPTLPKHQKAIVAFNEWIDSEYNQIPKMYQEIETNGTVYIEDELFKILDQINCSAKLSNSGMSLKKRISEKAINRIMEHENYKFKFVISNETDITEIFETYVEPFKIPLKNVVCMPGLVDQNNFFERTRFVMEMAKKYKFIGLTRNHIAAWDAVTGV